MTKAEEFRSETLVKLDSFARPVYEHLYKYRAIVSDPNNPNLIYYCIEKQKIPFLQNDIIEYNTNSKKERLVYSYTNKRVASLSINSNGQLLITAYDAAVRGEIVCLDIGQSQVDFSIPNEYLYEILGGVWLNDTSFSCTKFAAGPSETLIYNGKGEKISAISIGYDDLVILSSIYKGAAYYRKTNGSIQTFGRLNFETQEYQTSFKFYHKSYPSAFVRDKAKTGFLTIQPLTHHLYHFNENTNLITQNTLFQDNIVLNYISHYPDNSQYLIAVSVYSTQNNQLKVAEYFALSNLEDNTIKIIKEIHY